MDEWDDKYIPTCMFVKHDKYTLSYVILPPQLQMRIHDK